jgi:phosphoglycolate phosphatase-like HAD superfamily hydrolase
LIERAAEDLQLSVSRSVMVGDKRLDAETGRRAGAAGVVVRTGYGGEEADPAVYADPGHVADDLQAAAAWIIARGETLPS